MSLRLSTSCIVALALVGCTGKTKIDTTAQDDTGYAIHDTGIVDSEDSGGDDTQDTHHTGETDESGDSDTGETADTTESGDSGGTGVIIDTADTAAHPDVRAITVSPGAMTVNPGATYAATALVVYRDGTSDTPADLTWSTYDPKVATVDTAGVVTAFPSGETAPV